MTAFSSALTLSASTFILATPPLPALYVEAASNGSIWLCKSLVNSITSSSAGFSGVSPGFIPCWFPFDVSWPVKLQLCSPASSASAQMFNSFFMSLANFARYSEIQPANLWIIRESLKCCFLRLPLVYGSSILALRISQVGYSVKECLHFVSLLAVIDCRGV